MSRKEDSRNVVTKDDLADAVAKAAGIKKELAKKTVQSVFDYIVNAVTAEQTVTVSGFGVFKPVTRAARTGRNPQTGETIQIPERYSVAFKPYGKFKENMNAKAGK